MLPTYPQIEISPVTCLTGGRNDKNPRLKDKFSTFFYSPQAPNTAPPKALHECSRKTAKVVFKTWLHLKTQKVVHQSQTGALGRCTSKGIWEIWTCRGNIWPSQSLSTILCCNWQSNWIPWVSGLGYKQSRVRNFSRLREQTSVLTNYLGTKRKLFSVAQSSWGFTSMRMPYPWPTVEECEYFFFPKGVLCNIV